MKYPILSLAGCSLFISGAAIAHNKVVVIPMVGDDIPAISHPVADTLTNSIGMKFNKLPAGSFTMGAPMTEPGYSVEAEHTVTLSNAFLMQTTEVTQGQWDDVMLGRIIGGQEVGNPSGGSGGDTYPIEFVRWYDAVYFANLLSEDETRSVCYTFSGVSGTPGDDLAIGNVTQNAGCTGYRLPTEAEWEYAARAGTTKAYANPIGFDDLDMENADGFNGNLHAMGWYTYNQEGFGYARGPKPVAKKQANGWDLYDMHGNVWEWTWDWYEITLGSDPVTDPSGPPVGDLRVIRGGSVGNGANDARSAYRAGGRLAPDSRSSFVGFRLVLSQVE